MTPHAVQEPPVEKRLRSLAPDDFTPVVGRLKSRAYRVLDIHDLRFIDWDDKVWQTGYKLRGHTERVTRRHIQVGVKRGLNSKRLLQRDLEGTFHDIGKDHPNCHIYRLRRILLPAEREVIATHSSFSALDFLEGFDLVRKTDLIFLAPIYGPVCFHHKLHVLLDQDERMDATDLRIVDAIEGFTEERHRPGFSVDEALNRVRKWIQGDFYPTHYKHLRKEAEESFEIAQEVFLEKN